MTKINREKKNNKWNISENEEVKRYYLLSNKFLEQGNFQEAIIYYKKALEIDPQDILTLSNLGRAYHHSYVLQSSTKDLSLLDNSEACYLEATKIDPNFWLSYFTLGVIKIERKEFLKALTYHLKFLTVYEKAKVKNFKMYNHAANYIVESIKKGKISVESFKKLLNISISKEVWSLLGYGFLHNQLYESAELCFLKVIEKHPDYSSGYIDLGNVYMEMIKNIPDYCPDLNKIKKYLKKAIELDTNNETAWNNLGTYYTFVDDFEKAKFCYKTSIKLKNYYITPWYSLASIYVKKGLYKEAIKCLKKVVQIDPNYTPAKEALDILKNNTKEQLSKKRIELRIN